MKFFIEHDDSFKCEKCGNAIFVRAMIDEINTTHYYCINCLLNDYQKQKDEYRELILYTQKLLDEKKQK